MGTRVVFDCNLNLDLTLGKTINRTKSDEVKLIKVHILGKLMKNLYQDTDSTSERSGHWNFKEKIIQEKRVKLLWDTAYEIFEN